MSKRPTATNLVAAKRWTLSNLLRLSRVAPGCLPRGEPELVRSLQEDSPQVPAPTLPQVDAELVRSISNDSFIPTTDCQRTVKSEVINDSNGNSEGIRIEASSPVKQPETEPPNLSHSLYSAFSTPNPEPAAVTAGSLPPTELETVSTPHPEPAAVTAYALLPTEPEVRSSIARPSRQQIAAQAAECPTKKKLGRSRDFESANGYRRLRLLTNKEVRLVFQTAPNGLAAEQFRLVRRALSKEFESGAVLLITSPAVGDGKTLTSVNLASCLAESGQPTLLIEADIRRPTIRHILNGGVEPPGVEDVLACNVEPRRAVHGIEELNLYAAMVTRIPDDPAQLIGGPGVKHLLAWARENFLWVVLDAPPALPAADVSELLPFADAAVLVIRAQSTPRELVKQAVEILGKHLRGVIFNEVTVDSNPHYRYLNNYYYPQKSDSKSEGGRSIERTKSV